MKLKCGTKKHKVFLVGLSPKYKGVLRALSKWLFDCGRKLKTLCTELVIPCTYNTQSTAFPSQI